VWRKLLDVRCHACGAITNNDAVRRTLLERGIRPESLPPAEDVKNKRVGPTIDN